MPEISVTKTTTFRITDSRPDMMKFNKTYRSVRANMKYKGFECFSCKHKFDDNEKIGIIFTRKGNKSVCNSCAIKFQEELRENK